MTACESVCVRVKCSLTLSTCLSNELALQQNVRLRAHVYVFKKIRFRKDSFWGVHTYRTSIRRPRSHERGLIRGNVPPPENHGLCVRTRLELKSHFFVCFLCLPLSFFCIASRARAPWKKCTQFANHGGR